jgi:hypothetical protein
MSKMPVRNSFLSGTFSSKAIFYIAFGLLVVNVAVVAFNASNGLGYPFDTFLLNPIIRFSDFFQVVDGFGIVDIWGGPSTEFIYYDHTLPVVTTIYLLSAKLIQATGNQYFVLFLLFAVSFAVVFVVSKRRGNSLLMTLLALCSYPVLMDVDRGNIAILVFAFLLVAMASERVMVSTLALALAASVKLTPIVFLIPFLLGRPLTFRWVFKVLMLVAGWFVVINALVIAINGTVLSPHEYNPGVLFTRTIEYYNRWHVTTLEGLPYGSSLYMPLVYFSGKLEVLTVASPQGLVVFFGAIVMMYLWLSGTIVDTVERFLIKPNMIFIACICFILFMPVSADYYLIMLLIPLLLFPQTQFSLGYVMCYGILLAPKNYAYIDYINGYLPLSPQVFINPVLLVLLFLGEFGMIKFIRRDMPGEPEPNAKLIAALRQFTAAYVQPYRRKIMISSAVIVLAVSVMFFVQIKRREAHNTAAGLPIDFDPEIYLRLHPGLEEYWHSVGMFESGQALLDHAEMHYLYFGAKDNWTYRSTLQKILYPRF